MCKLKPATNIQQQKHHSKRDVFDLKKTYCSNPPPAHETTNFGIFTFNCESCVTSLTTVWRHFLLGAKAKEEEKTTSNTYPGRINVATPFLTLTASIRLFIRNSLEPTCIRRGRIRTARQPETPSTPSRSEATPQIFILNFLEHPLFHPYTPTPGRTTSHIVCRWIRRVKLFAPFRTLFTHKGYPVLCVSEEM
ncbi:hypothetical protein CDAR_394311 [Caerostris darwini]|uniref:Uncharacterized protein n=1 Tax=Caerostris darwini TaxID=1538125 RepID=A0AAV4RFV5_9ARAC|nr:hypothetical protein CDAR_394311 [Caerostris darwini]